jgi:hypothetical protein
MDRPTKKLLRCAIYTRKSTDHNLDLEFNSLDAQREACEAYIKSQAHEGWRLIPGHYDDGAFSGASLDRPALQLLLSEVRAGDTGTLRPDVRNVPATDGKFVRQSSLAPHCGPRKQTVGSQKLDHIAVK